MAPREELRSTVERLREELAAGEPLDARERETLERTLGEVAGLLDGTADAHPHTLADSLREAASRFESSHPKLTLAIGAVADSLARLGL